MSAQPQRYFDLSSVAALSRSLLAAQRAGVETAVASTGAAVPKPWRPFVAPQVVFSEELWKALLSWSAGNLAAESAFCLDKRGFLVAESGKPPEVSPEVLAAGFAAIQQFLEAASGGTLGVRRLCAYLGGDRLVQLWGLSLEQQEEVTLGFMGGRNVSEEDVARVNETFRTAFREFFANRAQG